MKALREFQRSKIDLADLLDAIDRLEAMTPKLNRATSDLEEVLEEELSERTRPKLLPDLEFTTKEAAEMKQHQLQ